jgi:hypothetical protein
VVRVGHPVREAMAVLRSGGKAIGRNPLFDRLIFNPDTNPKVWNVSIISLILWAWAGVMTTVSSANCSRMVEAVGRLMRDPCSF